MTDPVIVLVRDALLILLSLGTVLLVFWRLTNSKISFTWEAKTVAQEPAKADLKRLTAERDEARVMAAQLRDKLERKL